MNKHILKIEESALIIMQKHLENTWPDEGCGFFFGKDGAVRTVTAAYFVQNVKEGDKRRRFEISGLDYIKAEQYALEHQLDLLGVFHSHPNHPALPSEHDLKQAVSFFSYIIVSVYDGLKKELTSWRLNEERKVFEQEQVVFVEVPI